MSPESLVFLSIYTKSRSNLRGNCGSSTWTSTIALILSLAGSMLAGTLMHHPSFKFKYAEMQN